MERINMAAAINAAAITIRPIGYHSTSPEVCRLREARCTSTTTGSAWLAAKMSAVAPPPAAKTSAVPAIPATAAPMVPMPSPAKNSASGVNRNSGMRTISGPVVADANTMAETKPAPRAMRSEYGIKKLSRVLAVRDGERSGPFRPNPEKTSDLEVQHLARHFKI